MSKVTVKCERCDKPFETRVADRKRGWGKFCSKSCKAKKQASGTGVIFTYNEVYHDYDDRHPLDIDQ